MLVLSRKPGETIHIGPDVTVTVCRLRGDAVRLGIDAPPSVPIRRGEHTQPPGRNEEPTQNDLLDARLARRGEATCETVLRVEADGSLRRCGEPAAVAYRVDDTCD